MSGQAIAMLFIGIFAGVVGAAITMVWLLNPIPKDTDYYEDSIYDDAVEVDPADTIIITENFFEGE